METKETTNTAAAPVEVAEKSKRNNTRKAIPTIARRRVMTGQHKKTGAPKLEIIGLHVKKVRGPFTRQMIFDLNGQTISIMTISKRINEMKEAGQLVKMSKPIVNTTMGKPANRYNFDLSQGEVTKPKAKKVRKVKAEAVELPPAQPVEPAPAPAVDLNAVPAEQPAPAAV